MIISQIILDGLEDLNMTYPHMDKKRQEELHSFRKLLEQK